MSFAVITEGNIDYLLVKSFGYSRKEIFNVSGIGKVRNFIIKNNTNFDKIVAIVDQDNSNTLTKVFRDIIENKPFIQEDNYWVYRFKSIRNAYLVILCCPEIEDWIDKTLHQIGSSIKSFGYKNMAGFKSHTKTIAVANDSKILRIMEEIKKAGNYQLLKKRISTFLS